NEKPTRASLPRPSARCVAVCWRRTCTAPTMSPRHRSTSRSSAAPNACASSTATLALACLRLGENAVYGRGVDRLPTAVTDPLADALVRSLDEQELRRALAVATMSLIGELEEWDPALCSRLKPLLQEFGALQAEPLQ